MAVGMIGTQTRNWGHAGTRTVQRNPQNQMLIDQARRTNLVDLVGRYTQLRRKAAGEYEGPCPQCGGENRFTVDERGWFCRACKVYDEKLGWFGPIDFVMWMTGLDFKGAVGFLTGAQMLQGVQQRQPEPQVQAKPVQTDEWRQRADQIVASAQSALYAGDNPGAAYLAGRGLVPDTWQAFGFGFGAHHDQPAIVMPWYRGGKLIAIRYRYLQPQPGEAKIKSEFGSQFAGALYGGQSLSGAEPEPRTLVLCEGELNAASIWQVAHEGGVDVLSVGSESTALTDAMLALTDKYRHVIVWMDRPEIVDKFAQRIVVARFPRGCIGIASPNSRDANDYLREGMLQATIADLRLRACQNDAEKEALLWDLWDQHNIAGGVDEPTQALIAELRTELGK